jgi:hypothetical protein
MLEMSERSDIIGQTLVPSLNYGHHGSVESGG